MSDQSVTQLPLSPSFIWPGPAAADPKRYGVEESGDTRSATETPARAVAAIQGDAPDASGSLLDLLEEVDYLMNDVQFVLRRIGVELERLGISPRALSEPSQPKTYGELDSLSRRESEIVLLLLAGNRVSAIARALFISRHTVRNHLQSIFRKLRVKSQVELIEKLKGFWGWTSSPRKGRAVGVGIDSNTLRRCADIFPGHREFPRGSAEPDDLAE